MAAATNLFYALFTFFVTVLAMYCTYAGLYPWPVHIYFVGFSIINYTMAFVLASSWLLMYKNYSAAPDRIRRIAYRTRDSQIRNCSFDIINEISSIALMLVAVCLLPLFNVGTSIAALMVARFLRRAIVVGILQKR